MPIERIGFGRLYAAYGCSLAPESTGVRLRFPNRAEVEIACTPSPRYLHQEIKIRTRQLRAGTSEPAKLEKIADLGPDGIFTEIVAFDEVEVDAAESAAFRRRDPDGRTAVFRAAQAKQGELARYADVAAGLLGIRVHPLLVGKLLSEQVLAFRPGDDRFSMQLLFTTTAIPNLVVDLGQAFSSNANLVRLRSENSVDRAALILPFLLRAWSSGDDPINRFLSLFVPLEMILGDETQTSKWKESRAALKEIVKQHAGPRTKELLKFVDRLPAPPLNDRFAEFAKSSACPTWEADIAVFKRSNEIRNRLLHRGDREAFPTSLPPLQDIVHRYVAYSIFGDFETRLLGSAGVPNPVDTRPRPSS